MAAPQRAEGATIRPAQLDEILTLRHAVLRPGKPREAAIYAEDSAPDTWHLGAFLGGEPVSCATVLRNRFRGEPAQQLRGMATRPDWAGKGIGTRLLNALDAAVLADPSAPRLLWANARVSALPFYERQGWAVVSDEFDVPGIGPHKEIAKRLGGNGKVPA